MVKLTNVKLQIGQTVISVLKTISQFLFKGDGDL